MSAGVKKEGKMRIKAFPVSCVVSAFMKRRRHDVLEAALR